MRIAAGSFVFLAVVTVVSLSQSTTRSKPAVVYESNGKISIATSFGRILKTIKTVPRAGTFTVSGDAQKVVFTPAGKKPDSYGGPLYLLVLPNMTPTQLTHGPYYNKSAGSSEVYSNPNFSPDAKRVVFSVHAQSVGDAIEAAGPFATIDLESRKVAILPVTLHVSGEAWGTAYPLSAYWSPGGSHILLNFEDGFALTDSTGKYFEDLSTVLGGRDWTSSIGWFGSQCVIYIEGKDYMDAGRHPARFLNLKTRKTGALEDLLGVNKEQVTDLVTISGRIRVRRQGADFLVESGNDRWSIPDADGRSEVRILPRAPSEIPALCR